jgi:hypothetical protein
MMFQVEKISLEVTLHHVTDPSLKMLQYLDLLALCPLSPSFKSQLQRYTGEVDPVNHLVLSWILVLIRASTMNFARVKDAGTRREISILIGHKLEVANWDCLNERWVFIDKAKDLLDQILPIKSITIKDIREDDVNTYCLGNKNLSLHFITQTVDCWNINDSLDILREGWQRSFIKDGALIVMDERDDDL